MPWSHRLPILSILLLSLILRLTWTLHLPSDQSTLSPLPDQLEYFSLGQNLLNHHELSFFDRRFSQTIYAYRTPGYPAFIAACAANLRLIRIIQAILDTSTVLAIYLLASRWLPNRACLFAAILIAIDPFLIYFTGLILSESLFIALLAWGMALLATNRTTTKILAAFLLSMSILVRPSALLLSPLLILVISPRRRVLLLACDFAFVLLMLLPWALRNQTVLGTMIWTTTNSGITAYDGFNPHADGSSNQNFLFQMPQLLAMNEVQRNTYLSDQARRYALDHPSRTIELAMIKIARTWSPIPLSEEYGSRRLYVVAAACWSIPLDLLFLWGLWRGSLSRTAKVYCLLPAIYFTIVHALSVGSLRYRLPAEVIMIVIAVSGPLSVVRGEDKPQLTTDN